MAQYAGASTTENFYSITKTTVEVIQNPEDIINCGLLSGFNVLFVFYSQTCKTFRIQVQASIFSSP